MGKGPFRLSLQTDSLETALRRRPHAELEYFAKVDLGRAHPTVCNSQGLKDGQIGEGHFRLYKRNFGKKESTCFEFEQIQSAYLKSNNSNNSKHFDIEHNINSNNQKRTVCDLIEAHKADKVVHRSLSTQAAYEPVWRLLIQTLGANRPLEEIGRNEGREIFATAKALPRGFGKIPALRGLTVLQAVETGRELGLPVIAAKTINSAYMGLMKTIFTWAMREQWMSSNPLTGLSVEELVGEADKRDPFTLEQLRTIFSREPWKPRNEAPKGKPLHFWGPLIALFHGMRRGEIAQLDTKSLKIVNGQWCILIRGGDGKRLKTANARRVLPIHPELINIGFLRYAKRQQAANEDKLFSGERPNGNGQWGDGFSDWFSRQIRNEGLKGARLGLHSFRHNWQDRAREAGLHGTAIGQELAGRARGGDSSNNYGSGFSTEALAVASASITYPGLDLSHLYAK